MVLTSSTTRKAAAPSSPLRSLEGQGGDFDLHLFSPNVTKIPNRSRLRQIVSKAAPPPIFRSRNADGAPGSRP